VLAGDLDAALQAFSHALALDPADALALYGGRAVALRHADGTGDAGAADPIHDPDVARMIAARGVAPVAGLAAITSLEP
jgi:hypothetical protein